MATSTPWGKSQYREKHFKGCITYCTASHGGIHIAPILTKYLSGYTQSRGIEYGKGIWYEEDMDYILPLYELCKIPEFAEALSERYKIPSIEQVKSLFPDYEE